MNKHVFSILIALGFASGCGEIREADSESDNGAIDEGIAIDLVSPSAGPVTGGTAVTLLGSGFDGEGTTVLVDGRRALDVEVVSKNTLTFRTPANELPGPVEIRVFSSNGFGALSDAFTYAGLTTLASIAPAAGPPQGGTTITLSGSGFVDGQPGTLAVLFGDSPVPFETIDDKTLTITAPAGQAFTAKDIQVTSRNGTGTIANAYTYVLPGLLAADGQNRAGRLYHVDPETAEATVLRELPRSVSGLLTRADGSILATTNSPAGIAEIGLLDDTFVDIVTMASPLPDLIETDNGRLMGVLKRHQTSVVFDMDNEGSVGPFQGPVANVNANTGCGIARSSAGKIFFSGQGSNGPLHSFSGNTLVEETSMIDPSGGGAIMALTFFEDRLYGIRKGAPGPGGPGGGGGNGGVLVQINVSTGQVTPIGALPPDIDALSVMPGSL